VSLGNDLSPAYQIPFSQEQSAKIGVFVAMWGQIDVNLALCTAKLLQAPINSVELLMETMTTGPRLNLFRRLAKEHITDEDIKETAAQFASGLDRLIQKRNHILHGMWGYWVDQEHRRTIPAANHSRYGVLFIGDLPEILANVATHTQLIAKVFRYLYDSPEPIPGKGPAQFFGDGEPPSWL
jgi:hypothetical protein